MALLRQSLKLTQSMMSMARWASPLQFQSLFWFAILLRVPVANYHEKVIDHYENPRCLNSWWITETTTFTGTLAWISQTCMEQECGQDGPQVKQGGHWPCGCSSLWRCHEAADWGWPPFQLFNLTNKDIVTLVLWRLTMMERLWMPSSRPLAVALPSPPPGKNQYHPNVSHAWH